MQKPSPSPNKRALLIGINDYPKLPARQLYGCINDVDLMHDLLMRRFGFLQGDIKKLCNKEATRVGILKAFKDLVASVKTNDVVVVHFSGHGSQIQNEKKGSDSTETIVPHDCGRESTGFPSTDITDVEVATQLLEPLIRKTPFVTLLFDSCHSGSVLRDDFGTAVRGIDSDGEVRKSRGTNDAGLSGWFCNSPLGGYALLAACRADELAYEITTEGKSYGAFTYLLCGLINKSRSQDMRTLFQLASADITTRFPHQHPILEGAHDAVIFGKYQLETLRALYVKNVKTEGGKTMIEMDGGLASGVTCGSIWAVRPLGGSPQASDAQIKVREAFAFESHAEVIHKGHIEVKFGCFEISHVYEGAVLKILVDSQGDLRFKNMVSSSGNSNVHSSLNIVESAANSDLKVALLQPRRTVAKGDMVPQLGPLNRETWVALARDGRIIIPPTSDLSDLCENLRKLARYRFGLTLHNLDEQNELRGKLSLELKRRPKGSLVTNPWENPPLGKDGFPRFQNGDHIACVINNRSSVKVWVYVLEFAEDGSVHQRYPYGGGEEPLASGRTSEVVAQMILRVSSDNAFQLMDDNTQTVRGGVVQSSVRGSRKHFTEALKLFASTERVDLSLLLQTSFTVRGIRGLSSLLRIGDPIGNRGDVCAWWTVEKPFVLESDGA